MRHPNDPVTVSVSPVAITGASGETIQFTATVTNTTDTSVTWSSSDETVVTIDSNGLATIDAAAVADETATITATSVEDPAVSGSATLTVV